MTHDEQIAQRNAAIIAGIKKYTAENTVSKEAAMAALIRGGFFTSDGKVAPAFAPSKKAKAGA
ncbi:MAG: hypothetical protein RL367_1671 [Pseudomonadota bacterium]